MARGPQCSGIVQPVPITLLLCVGGKILLNNARLHLKRGKRYGLCGPNGAGKSTLMRSIANGQLDGFPPKDELRTVYVEHDIDASESNVPVVEYVYSDPILQDASHPAHTQVSEVLGSVGFTEAMQQAPVSSLSGGWKMKLALGESFFSFWYSHDWLSVHGRPSLLA